MVKMTLAQLISSVPAATNLDSMAEWFGEVQLYATKEETKNFDIYVTSSAGLFFSSNSDRVAEYRRIVLAQLKALQTG